MMSKLFLKIFTTFFLFIILIICPFAMADAKPLIKKIVVFGDSLSDTGNTAYYTGNNDFFTMVPQYPYFQGHFTNGYVWDEDVAKKLGWSISNDNAESILNSPLQVFAYGGAWAASGVENKSISNLIIPDLYQQVSMYINYLWRAGATTDAPKNNTLFIIFAGGNDFLSDTIKSNHWLNAYYQNSLINNAYSAIANAINLLKTEAGAKYIAVASLPDVSLTPFIKNKGPKLAAVIHNNIVQFNKKLYALAQKEGLPYVDIYSIFNAIYNKYNCTDCQYTLLPCVSKNLPLSLLKENKLLTINNPELQVTARTIYAFKNSANPVDEPQDQPEYNFDACTEGDPSVKNHLFWDGVHPTAVIHQQVANLLLSKQYLSSTYDFYQVKNH